MYKFSTINHKGPTLKPIDYLSALFRNRSLTNAAKIVAAFLFHENAHSGTWRTASLSDLAFETGTTEITARAAVRQLKETGWIEVDRSQHVHRYHCITQ